jgi:hypothetical protein
MIRPLPYLEKSDAHHPVTKPTSQKNGEDNRTVEEA